MHGGDITAAGGARGGRRARHRAGGFTLTELMVVVGIIAIVSAIAFFGFARPSAASQATSISRDLFFAMHRARLQATTSGQQVQVWLCRSVDSTCAATGTWIMRVADQTGMSPLSWTTVAERGVITKRDAWVSAVSLASSGVTIGATTNVSMTFRPDGTAESGGGSWDLVTVVDQGGATEIRIRVFLATGLVRQWQTK